MTVKQMAAELGVTPMTVYRRLKRAGIAITELRDDVTNELTPNGIAIIGSLFDATEPTTEGATSTEQVAQPETKPDMSVDCAVLQAKLDGMEQLLRAVTDERDALRRQVSELTALLREQQRLLPAGHERRGGGLFGWFRRRGSGE